MDKIKKYTKQIIVGILLIIGVITIIFGKNLLVQLGITCLCWGCAIFIMVLITKRKQEQELIDFDKQSHELLEDIATRGEESEYFPYYNIDIINNIRNKLVKKHKKQIFSCSILGVVLIIISIICVF